MDSRPLRVLRNIRRSGEIATVLINHGFGDLVERLHLRRYLQWGRRVVLRRNSEDNGRYTRAQRFRMVLETLGPTFIKFGQVLSTRPDLFPADLIDELSKLQEQVPPFDSNVATDTLRSELGEPVEKLFLSFDREPLAAGSLGQVHRARHLDGTELAVKIRRPDVVREVERDLPLMLEVAILIERHIPEARVFEPVGLVNHFARTIRRELNFAREGRTMQAFERLFHNDATLVIPRIYPELTTDAVVTMQYIEGYHVTDRDKLLAAGISPQFVAANGARIFMKQAFELGVFHSDPHPGNIRILPDGSICLLDYGMVGLLEDDVRDQLIDLFRAIVEQDVATAVDQVYKLGKPFQPIDLPMLRCDVRDFIENYYSVPLQQLKLGRVLTDFIAILSHHSIRCPADLMLLIRAIVTLEGVGRELDPAFNLAEHLAPFVEQVVRDRYNPKRLASMLFAESRMFLQLAHDAPLFLGRSLKKLSEDDLHVHLDHGGLDHLITELDRSSNRLVIGLVMSSMIVASALIIRGGTHTWISAIVFVVSCVLGIWLIAGVLRSGRL